ncbi:hypothetical protein EYC80_008791 [Monilinia laxa]|uniref:Uncharacterized protein n=1 Tax=Monilinia laxa TaxID=61186 RepID=A0A5N6K1R3_MONLA|nr:hypothetical protein EYC80_008791 [Monilinia laxa]
MKLQVHTVPYTTHDCDYDLTCLFHLRIIAYSQLHCDGYSHISRFYFFLSYSLQAYGILPFDFSLFSAWCISYIHINVILSLHRVALIPKRAHPAPLSRPLFTLFILFFFSFRQGNIIFQHRIDIMEEFMIFFWMVGDTIGVSDSYEYYFTLHRLWMVLQLGHGVLFAEWLHWA